MNWTERVVPFHLHPLGFIDAFVRNGAELSQLLDRAGISPAMLDLPKAKISYRQLINLFRSGIQLCNRADLGLRVGRYFDWAYYGLPGLAIQSSTSFKQAALILHRYTCLAQPYYAAYKSRPAYFVDNQQRVTIPVQYFISSELDDDKVFRFELEFRVGLILQLLHHFIDPREGNPRDVEVHLSIPQPFHTGLYEQLAAYDFKFNCKSSRFVLPAAMMRVGEDQMRRAITEHVLQYCGAEMDAMEGGLTCTHRVMALLYEHIPHFLNQSEVANFMGITTRTLARRLQQENTSFTDVLNAVRSEIATYFLESTQLSVPDVAESLGFSDTGNFRQAFKRWTGRSACDFRALPRSQQGAQAQLQLQP